MNASILAKDTHRSAQSNRTKRLQEIVTLKLEDLLWEYIEEYGFSENAKRFFEHQYPIYTSATEIDGASNKA